MTMATRNLVIYDADPDGFGCAYAAWEAFGIEDTDYIEVLHGTDMPEDAYDYENVYILDLSFPYEDLYALTDTTSVTVIDHHPSAKETVERLRLNPEPFNTEDAACVQSWDFFHPYLPCPKILQYVGDRDTWTFALPYSEEINQYIYTIDQNPLAWAEANRVIEDQFEDALKIGTSLVVYRDKLVEEIVADTTTVTQWNGYYNSMGIPFVAAPVLHSEVGHRLLEMFPYSPFSVTFSDNPNTNTRKYSLRSEDSRADVGAFAKARGGGGHHNAAGFSKSLDEIWKEGYESLN
jgi:uncharacterized protein